MIKRDKYGIICQVQDDGSLDGGDSDNRTGIMALCGSSQDIQNLPMFLVPAYPHYMVDTVTFKNEKLGQKVVRHPYDAPLANDPANTSRDQIVAYFAPAKDSQKDAALFYARSWFINKDFLDPSVRLYLYKSAGAQAPLYIKLLGYPLLFLSLLWNCFVSPEHEQNQFICICNRMGIWWLQRLYDWHPDLFKNVRDYWGGWRDQPDIGEALCNFIASRVR